MGMALPFFLNAAATWNPFKPGSILSKEDLILKIWGADSEAVDNNAEAYISFLRKKLFYLGSKVQITSQRRLGYLLEEGPC